ncbi:MAG TPA: NADH-ubiquinone oxidoreductase-F iron-sulfur binding region domain-containing protein [Streptosporangiaceae bacterium]
MTASPPVLAIGGARLTAGFDHYRRLDAQAHRAVHGTPRTRSLRALTALAESVDLRGRGGAAFPFARKLAAVAESARRQDARPVVLVNATEGEPASGKDAVLVTRAPHLVLAGAMLAADALGSREVTIGVTAHGGRSLRTAIAQWRQTRRVRVVVLPERFVTGEGGALVRGVNGGPAIPPGRKVRAAQSGVDGRPTLLSNAETYAQLALLAALGRDRYAAVGTREEPGTVLLTVTTPAGRTVVETPTGVALEEVLRLCGTGPGQAVLAGGYHGAWLGAQAAATATVSRAGFERAGATLGAGVIAVLPADTCPLGEVARIAAYLGAQSSGQCGPCRLGLPAIGRALGTLANGTADADTVVAIRRGADAVTGRGACHHPDGTTRFIRSALDVFADDVARHLDLGGCHRPVRGVLPLPDDEAAPPRARLVVDWTRCSGHGLCAHLVPDLVSLDGDGYPSPASAPVPGALAADAARAVAMCPALALRLESQRG